MSADSTSPATTPASAETSRRRLLALAAGGSAAAAAGLLSADRSPAGHDATNVFHLGESNTNPADPTTLMPAGSGPALNVFADNGEDSSALQVGGGAHFFKEADPGDVISVLNEHADGGNGISARVNGEHAVEGVSVGSDVSSAGVVGVSGEGEDYGFGPSVGVRGSSGTGMAVHAFSPATGFGVYGHSVSGIGVNARSDEGVALRVEGPAIFSTSGNALIPAGKNNHFVAHDAVADDSHITVTFTGNPGARRLKWVELDPGNGFTVHCTSLLGSPRPKVAFTYLIINLGGLGIPG